MKVLTVSDSDSYLKWSAALVEQLSATTTGPDSSIELDQVVLANVIAPSTDQIEAAVPQATGEVATMAAIPLLARIRRTRPDVVLLSCTGPALAAVVELLRVGGVLGAADRPVLVSGLPGISFPANATALELRAGVDLMVLHSHREVTAYSEQWRSTGHAVAPGLDFALARLPYLASDPGDPHDRGAAGDAEPQLRSRSDVVFAAQSLVPAGREDRLRVLRALAALPDGLTPVVKLRAVGSQRQAHNEKYAYPDLVRGHTRGPEPEDSLARVEFRAGSMRRVLADAHGFATVSSTAVLEAIAAGVPSLVLEDFGVGAEQINLVFEGSGLFGSLDDLAAGRFVHPDAGWLQQNYFHPVADDDWIDRLTALLTRRRESGLEPVRVSAPGRPLTRLRRQLRVQPPMWVWNAANSARTRRSPD